MKLVVREVETTPKSTLSVLTIDDAFECFTLEDTYRPEKVWGETRIPGGTYKLVPRTAGRHYRRYSKRWGHEFTIYQPDVPGFEWIMWHVGNSFDDSEGCLLVGKSFKRLPSGDYYLLNSTQAYKRLYDRLTEPFRKDGKVDLEIIRNERPVIN